MSRRVIALVLILSMILTGQGVTAFAEELESNNYSFKNAGADASINSDYVVDDKISTSSESDEVEIDATLYSEEEEIDNNIIEDKVVSDNITTDSNVSFDEEISNEDIGDIDDALLSTASEITIGDIDKSTPSDVDVDKSTPSDVDVDKSTPSDVDVDTSTPSDVFLAIESIISTASNIVMPQNPFGTVRNLSIDLNGGTWIGSIDPTQYKTFDDENKWITMLLPSYINGFKQNPDEYVVKDGYVVDYVEFNGKRVANDTVISINQDIKAVVYWKEATVEYTISFDTKGGSTVSPTSFKKTKGTAYTGNLPTTTKKGYKFDGWYYSKDNKDVSYNKSNDDIYVSGTTQYTIFAKWSPVSYKINYDANGGSVNPTSFNKTYSTSYTGTLATPTKQGYTFNGWYMDNNVWNKSYDKTKDDIYVDEKTTYKIYAKWTPETYTITYVTNHGTVSPTSFSKKYDTAYTGNLAIPTDTPGYKFIDWYTNDKFEKVYNKSTDDAYVSGGQSKIYAKWDPIKYFVKFVSNGSEVSIEYKYDENIDLGEHGFKNGDASIYAWVDESGHSYAVNSTNVSKLSTTAGTTVTLTAVWKYKVTFDMGGHGTAIPAQYVDAGGKATKPTNNPTEKGYKFIRYWTDNENTDYNFDTAVNKAVVIHIKWQPNKYTLILDPNGGSGTAKSTDYDYGQTVDLKNPGFTNGDKSLALWNENNTGTGKSYRVGATDVSNLKDGDGDTITLFADWGATYKVVFHSNYGTDTTTDQDIELGKKTQLKENSFTRTGYKFIEWNTDKNGKGTKYSNKFEALDLVNEKGKSFPLFAIWQPISYTLTLDPGDGTGTATSTPYKYTDKIVLRDPGFTRIKHRFKKWTTPDGKTYDVDEEVSGLSTSDGGTITLKPVWEEINANYEVRFNMKGHGKQVPTQYHIEGESITVPAAPTEAGYTFEYWYLTNENTAFNFTGYTITKALELKAKWRQNVNKYVVRLNASSAESAVTYKDFEIDNGQAVTFSTYDGDFTKSYTTSSGYKFELTGWKRIVDKKYTLGVTDPYFSRTQQVSFNELFNGIYDKVVELEAVYTLSSDNPKGLTVTFKDTQKEITLKNGAVSLPVQSKELTYYGDIKGFITPNATYTTRDKLRSFSGINFNKDMYKTPFTISYMREGYRPVFIYQVPQSSIQNYTNNNQTFLYATDNDPENIIIFDGNQSYLDVQIYWMTYNYDIVLDPNGGNGGAKTLSNNLSNKTVKLSNPGFTGKNNYTLDSWNTEPDGSGTRYEVNSDSNVTLALPLLYQDKYSVTLYAQWLPSDTYTIRYSSNGQATGVMSDQKAGIGQTVTLFQNKFERSGYVFDGWNTQADGKGTSYAERASVVDLTKTKGATFTLFPIWKPIEYNIKYEPNGKSNAAAKTIGYKYNERIIMDENLFINDAYTITSWNTSKDGTGTNYPVGQSFQGLTTKAETITLYAQWGPIKLDAYFYINFDRNGGYGSMPQQRVPVGRVTYLNRNEFTKDYDKFLGWKDSNGREYSDKADITDLLQDGQSITLIAQWQVGYKNSITYYTNYPSGTLGAKEVINYSNWINPDFAQYLKNDMPDPVVGQAFSHWATYPTGTGNCYYPGIKYNYYQVFTANGTNNLELFAVYKPYSYFYVRYDPNGGEGTMERSIIRKNGAITPLPNLGFTKRGYTFSHFATTVFGKNGRSLKYNYKIFSEGLLRAEDFDESTVAVNNNEAILGANWIENEYKIEYDLKGGSWTVSEENIPKTRMYTASKTLPSSSALKKLGYTFDGWCEDENCNGTKYTSVPANSLEKKYYAKWKAVPYKIIYNMNGGSWTGTPPKMERELNEHVNLATNITKTGYTFKGWYTSNTYAVQATNVLSGTASNKTFWAKWEEKSYDVKYTLQVGTTTLTLKNPSKFPNKRKYSEKITLPTLADFNSFPQGYNFKGMLVDGSAKTEIPANTAKEVSVTVNVDYCDFTITWDRSGGTWTSGYTPPSGYSHNATIVTMQGVKIPSSADIKRSGYVLTGWKATYKRDGIQHNDTYTYTNETGFAMFPTQASEHFIPTDLKLTAVWEAAVTITLDYTSIFNSTYTDPSVRNLLQVQLGNKFPKTVDVKPGTNYQPDFAAIDSALSIFKSDWVMYRTADKNGDVYMMSDKVGTNNFTIYINIDYKKLTTNLHYSDDTVVQIERYANQDTELPRKLDNNGVDLLRWYSKPDFSDSGMIKIYKDAHYSDLYAKVSTSVGNVEIVWPNGKFYDTNTNTGLITIDSHYELPTSKEYTSTIELPPIEAFEVEGYRIDRLRVNGVATTKITPDISTQYHNGKYEVKPDCTPKSYKINYHLNGGTADISYSGDSHRYDLDTYFHDWYVTNLKKDNATFAGFYNNERCEGEKIKDGDIIAPAGVAKAVDIYVKWNNFYGVNFNLSTGDHPSVVPKIATQSVLEHEKATRPSDPSAEGWTFDGWYKDPRLDEEFDFNEEITKETTVFAKWGKLKYLATLNFAGHGNDQYINFNHGEKVGRPDDPEAEGYEFEYWHLPDSQSSYSFNEIENKDIDLIAKWRENEYQVQYDTDNGAWINPPDSSKTSRHYTENIQLPKKEDIEKENYVLDRWRLSVGNKRIDDKRVEPGVATGSYIADNILFTAEYKPLYEVKFLTKAGNAPNPEYTTFTEIATSVISGEKVERPVAPSAVGYDFDNWYKDETKNELFDFDEPITKETVIYAKWIPHQYTIKFDLSGVLASTPSSISKDYGESVTLPEPQNIPNGNMFLEWCTNESLIKSYDGTTDLATNNGDTVTIHARWLYDINDTSSVVLSSPSTITDYYVGDTFNPNGVKVDINKYSGKKETIAYAESNRSDFVFSGVDLTSAGDKIVTLTYKGQPVDGSFTIRVKQLEITEVRLSHTPTKLSYYVGNTFNPSGLTVDVTYNNGDTDTGLAYTESNKSDFVFSGVNTNSAGTKTVTLTYKGHSVIDGSFSIVVSAVTLSTVSVIEYPTKLSYYVGDTFDPSGLKVNAINNDGTSVEVTYSDTNKNDFEFSGADLSTEGNKEVSVSYKGKTAKEKINIEVKKIEITEAKLAHTPTKLSYYVGGTFSPSGLTIDVTYNNGDTDIGLAYTESNKSDFAFSGVDLNSAGTKTVTFTYKGNSVINGSFSIVVTAVTLSTVSIIQNPTKLSYYVGETFDPSGLRVKAINNNGTSVEVTYSDTNKSDFVFSGVDLSTEGYKSISVSYNGKTAKETINIEVKKIEITEVRLSHTPTKLSYYVGGTFDPSGLTVDVTYNNGDTDTGLAYTESNKSDFVFSGVNTNSVGTKTVTLTYKGHSVIDGSFSITVSAITLSTVSVIEYPTKLSYYVGDTFDPSGLKVNAINNDGTSVEVTYSDTNKNDFEFSGADLSTEGNKEVSVSYKGKTAKEKINIEVKKVEITEARLAHNPTKLSYYVGGTFSPSGLTIDVTYNNGDTDIGLAYTESNKSDFVFSGVDLNSTGTKTVTFTYKGHSVINGSFSIVVTAVTLSTVSVIQYPTKLSYYVGETFDPSGLRVNAINNDGTSVEVTYSDTNKNDFVFSGVDLSTEGFKSISVSYNGKTAKETINIEVKKIEISEARLVHTPTKLSYYVGGTFNPTGLMIDVIYNNGDTDIGIVYTESNKSDFVFSGVNLNSAGTKTVTLTYKGHSVIGSFSITVSAITLSTVSVIEYPIKLSYYAGETFDPSGLRVKAINNDGTSVEVTYNDTNKSDFVFSGVDLSTAGNKSISVSYKGKTAKETINIEVIVKSIYKVEVVNEPTLKDYIVGDKFNPNGLSVIVEYTDGDRSGVISYNNNVSMFTFEPSIGVALDKTNTGVRVYFGGHEADRQVDIKVYELKSVELSQTPQQTYTAGNSLNVSGLVLKCSYETILNATMEKTISYSDSTKDKFTFKPALTERLAQGQSDVKVTYGGFEVTYNIKVNAAPTVISKDSNSGVIGGGGGRSGSSIGAAVSQRPQVTQLLIQVTQQGNQPINMSEFGIFKRINHQAINDYQTASINNRTTVALKGDANLASGLVGTDKLGPTGFYKLVVDGKEEVYYLKDDSSIYCGWVKDENNNYHYFGDNGKMTKNCILTVGGRKYSVNQYGEVEQGNITQDDKAYLYSISEEKLFTGTTRYNPLLDEWNVEVINPMTGAIELVRGVVKLVQEDGINTYYFDSFGKLTTGYQTINGQAMYFDKQTGKKQG